MNQRLPLPCLPTPQIPEEPKVLADSLFSIDEEVNPDAIEIYIHRVRKKLEPGDAVIVTLRGLGYLLKPRYEQ